jgi:hypothetical protein
MYNGYNYYSPNGSSTTTSPVFIMPYPYQYDNYDPFFMAPNTEVPSSSSDNKETSEEVEINDDKKPESDDAKEEENNKEFAGEKNVS